MWSTVRQVVLRMARRVGIVRFCQVLHRKQIVILMVHGVMDDQEGSSSWKPLRRQLSRNKLEEYVRTLSQRYHFIPLAECVEMLQGRRPMQPYSIVLTFDDGYRNNFTHALPILRRYRVPATFCVSTGFLNNPRPFWCDRLDYALQHAQPDGREVKVGSLTMRLDTRDRAALQKSFLRFRRAAKEQCMPDEEFLRYMEELADTLERESGCALAEIQQRDDWSAILTWEQARHAHEDGITIGSHTVDHVRLGMVDADVARYQLVTSKRDIEAHIGTTCLSICYPSGSFTMETADLARECGYLCGLTTQEGLNSVGDDPMTLRRMNLSTETADVELLAQVCGLSESISCMKMWIKSVGRILAVRKRSVELESATV